jgi:hypothetical protein
MTGEVVDFSMLDSVLAELDQHGFPTNYRVRKIEFKRMGVSCELMRLATRPSLLAPKPLDFLAHALEHIHILKPRAAGFAFARHKILSL